MSLDKNLAVNESPQKKLHAINLLIFLANVLRISKAIYIKSIN